MAFSQQTYQGQGIVQPTERSRVGELLGAGIAGFGASIGEGIKKFQENKAEANELRSSLPGLAKFLPKSERDEFLEQVAVSDLSGLRGLRRKAFEYGEMQLQQERLAEARARREALEQQSEQTRQKGNVFQALLAGRTPQEVNVPRTDYTPDIEQARSEERRLEGMMKFAPQPEGAMETGASLSQIQRMPSEAGPTAFDPTYAQFVRENLPPEGMRDEYQKSAAQRAGVLNEEYARSMASKASQAQQALSQLEGEVSKPLEDVRNQIKILEAKQDIETKKPKTRLETSQEMANRRAETIRKVISDNPLAAETIYTALMGKTTEPPKLDVESRKTIGFADRMTNAEAELSSVLAKFNPAGTFQGIASAMPNFMKSEERQQYEALALDWITANLRQESGAAIGPDEYKNDFKKYFPQPGDSAKTVKLKQSLREQAIESKVAPIQSMFPTVDIMGMGQAQRPMGRTVSYGMSGKPEIR